MNVADPVTPEMLAVARSYYEAGLAVMPPKMDGSKTPYVPWAPYQERRPTPKELKLWYARGLTGVGTICGAVSGNLELFEFDWYDTYLAFVELAEQAGLGELVTRIKDGYCESTPGGGIHWFYRCEEIEGNTKLASRPTKTGAKVLIETRGEGGFAIMAPSHGPVHPSGNAYEVIGGSVETIADITAEERRALWQLARSLDEMPECEQGPVSSPSVAGDRPGDIFNDRYDWRDILEPHGWRYIYKKGDTRYWRRPGKDIGISASTNHSGRDTLMVFSTSTTFDSVPASYTKFAAYAVLNHKGDFQAASKDLWAQGFRSGGSQTEAPRLSATTERVDPVTGEIVTATIDGRVDLWPFISGGVPEPEWLVDGVLLPGMVETFHGEPGCGKTIITLGFTRDLVRAGKNVLFIDEESGPQMTASRLALMGLSEEEAARIHYYPFAGLTLDDSDALLATVLQVAPTMVIFDSMADVLTASHLSEDASTDVTNWMVNVAVRIARSIVQPTVVILDHNTKDGLNTKYARGSGAKKAKADISFYVEKRAEFDASTLGRVALLRTKNRVGFVPEKVEYVVGGRDGELVVEPYNPQRHGVSSLSAGAETLLEILRDRQGMALQNQELQGLMGCGHDAVVQRAKELMSAGLIERVGSGRMTAYQINHPADDFFRPPDEAYSSDFSSGGGPPYRGHRTKDGIGDENSAAGWQEEDVWN